MTGHRHRAAQPHGLRTLDTSGTQGGFPEHLATSARRAELPNASLIPSGRATLAHARPSRAAASHYHSPTGYVRGEGLDPRLPGPTAYTLARLPEPGKNYRLTTLTLSTPGSMLRGRLYSPGGELSSPGLSLRLITPIVNHYRTSITYSVSVQSYCTLSVRYSRYDTQYPTPGLGYSVPYTGRGILGRPRFR